MTNGMKSNPDFTRSQVFVTSSSGIRTVSNVFILHLLQVSEFAQFKTALSSSRSSQSLTDSMPQSFKKAGSQGWQLHQFLHYAELATHQDQHQHRLGIENNNNHHHHHHDLRK
jgi:hypothetical protein